MLVTRIINVNDNKYEFVCRSEKNYSGFKHIATLYINGECTSRSDRQYYNRTWEMYDFQSVMIDIVKGLIATVNEIYLEQFKTEKGYKRMTEKRNLEFNNYIALDNVYQEELKELEYVLNDLETKSY